MPFRSVALQAQIRRAEAAQAASGLQRPRLKLLSSKTLRRRSRSLRWRSRRICSSRSCLFSSRSCFSLSRKYLLSSALMPFLCTRAEGARSQELAERVDRLARSARC